VVRYHTTCVARPISQLSYDDIDDCCSHTRHTAQTIEQAASFDLSCELAFDLPLAKLRSRFCCARQAFVRPIIGRDYVAPQTNKANNTRTHRERERETGEKNEKTLKSVVERRWCCWRGNQTATAAVLKHTHHAFHCFSTLSHSSPPPPRTWLHF
jgi:hypothetical protein